MDYLGDFDLDATVNLFFTTHDKSGAAIAPSTALEAADLIIYKNALVAQKTSTNGITISSPFDSVVGLHLVTIDTSNDTADAGFWTAGSEYTVVLSPDETVDGETVVRVLAQFSTENRSALRPTVAGRTLDIAAGGEAGVDFANINSTLDAGDIGANAITAAKIAAGALDGKGDWNIGKTGYSLTQAFPTNFADLSIVVTTGLVDITQAAADKVWGTATRQLTALQAGIIAATSFAANAIDAAALAADAVDEIADGVWNELLAGHVTADSAGLLLNEWQDGGRLDVILDARAAEATVAGLNDISTAQVNTEVDTALADIHLDHLLAVDYNPAAKPGVATALLNELVENDGGISRFTSNALEQLWGVTLSELSSVPAATPTASQAVMLAFMAIRNKRDTTATSDEIHNSAGGIIGTAVLSDDAVTFVKGKYA